MKVFRFFGGELSRQAPQSAFYISYSSSSDRKRLLFWDTKTKTVKQIAQKKKQKRNTWAPTVHLLTFQNHSAVPFLSTAANSAAFPLWLLPSSVMSIGQRRDQIIAINAALSSDTGRITLRWELVCLRALRKVQWEDTRKKMSATVQIFFFLFQLNSAAKVNACVTATIMKHHSGPPLRAKLTRVHKLVYDSRFPPVSRSN